MNPIKSGSYKERNRRYKSCSVVHVEERERTRKEEIIDYERDTEQQMREKERETRKTVNSNYKLYR